MGFLDLFKKETKETLALPENFGSGVFIQPLNRAMLEIKLGQKIKVNKGYWAVLVLKDKPMDVFDEGEWEITIPNIPKINRRLKLDKSRLVKNGDNQELVFQDKFKCDIYFVSKDVFKNQQWQTYLVRKKLKNQRRFCVLMRGSLSFKSMEPCNTIKLFLLEWAKIDEGKAHLRLKKYINEFVTEALDWQKISSYKDLSDEIVEQNYLLPKLQKNFDKYSIEISDFRVDKIELGKELDEEIRLDKIENDISAEKTELSAEISLEDKKVESMVVTRGRKSIREERKISNDVPLLDLTKPDEELDKKSLKTDVEPILDDFKSVKLKKVAKPAKIEEDDFIIKTVEKDDAIEQPHIDGKTKVCPKCKKIHSVDDDICECGCNLD